jgi:hypothetical protein
MATVAGRSDVRVASIVGDLVARGLVEPHRAAEAEAVIRSTLEGTPAEGASLRRRLTEVAGYLGGAFVVAAAVTFMAQEWADLSLGQQVFALVATSALLFAAAVLAIASGPGGLAEHRRTEHSVRGRLSSLLACGGVVAAAFAVGVYVSAHVSLDDEALATFSAALVVLVLGVVVYVVAPTALVQIMLAVAACLAVPTGLYSLVNDLPAIAFGLLVLSIGLGWLLLAETRVWQERATGRLLGCLLALIGAQLPLTGTGSAWLAYTLTALLAVAAVAGYVWSRTSVYLAVGVVAVTIVVPEALLDWTEGSLGPVGVLLVAGLTLLVASLVGLRLRREVTEA